MLNEAAQGCDTAVDTKEVCTRWMKEEGGAACNGLDCLSERCCSAGFGFHHYAVKSREAQEWKQRRGQRDPSPPLHHRDLNWVVSPSALRFLSALRQRFPSGASPNVELTTGQRRRYHIARGVGQGGGEVGRVRRVRGVRGCCAACEE
eukprot:Hpha_TRINITY_DN31572_c0_g1::TRINITY_DN31572_c0_g1_i2::g.1654::m.1654